MTSLGLEMGAIDEVAQQGVADMGQMHADLVGAAGFQATGKQAGCRPAISAGKLRADFIMGNRGATALAHSHFFARVRVAVDWRINCAAGTARNAPDEREIAALHRTVATM